MSEDVSWIITEEDEASLDAQEMIATDAEPPAPQSVRRARFGSLVKDLLDRELLERFSRSRRLLVTAVFVSGLILGWIVIGRWLWPANRNADPWELRERHQMTYINLVAQDYARTGDVLRARRSLEGWDEEALTDLMVEMATRAASPQERQHLTALARALQLTDYQIAVATNFFLNKGVVFSFMLSASPLVAAMAMVIAPLFKQEKRKKRQENSEAFLLPDDPEQLEEMVQQGLVELDADGKYALLGEEGAAVMYRDELETNADEAKEEYAEGSGESEEEQVADMFDGEEDWEEWDEEEEGEEIDTEGAVADILMDLFDEDEGSLAYLEALGRGLPEVVIEDLLEKAQNIARRLKTEDRRIV